MPSFTAQSPNLKEVGPVVEVKIAVGFALEEVLKQKSEDIPTPVQVQAMIDTGATGTVVRNDLVRRLNLHPVGTTLIHTPSSTNVQCEQYLVRLILPNNVIAETVAIAAPLQGQHIECLIGRDILQHGVFIYTGYMNTFTLSF